MKINGNFLRSLNRFKSASQRFALMIAAVPSSYAIDTYFSGTKDEQTKTNARIKNVSKALACGIVGVAVRLLCDFGVDKYAQIGEIRENKGFVESAAHKKGLGFLLPNLKQRTNGMAIDALKAKRNKYVLVGSNVLAAFVMIFTNVFLDAPLTKLFTNIGIDRFGYPAGKEGVPHKGGKDEKA